jgi:hypothetical protein
MSDRLGARVVLLAAQPVPFPLQLDNAPVAIRWNEDRLREIANDSPVDTAIRIYLCRNRIQTLRVVLQPGSLVIIGRRRCWWPTAEARMARELRRLGHEVILAETE